MQALLDHARNVTIVFATAEWIELFPDFVKGVEEVLRKLAPGETLGSAFPLEPSATSGDSGPTLPSGSGAPRHDLPAPAGGRSDPVVHFPEATQRSPVAAAPPPAAVVAARRALFVSGPGKRPADWVNVRHSPPISLVFLTASRIVQALQVAAFALRASIGRQAPLQLLLFLSERRGGMRSYD